MWPKRSGSFFPNSGNWEVDDRFFCGCGRPISRCRSSCAMSTSANLFGKRRPITASCRSFTIHSTRVPMSARSRTYPRCQQRAPSSVVADSCSLPRICRPYGMRPPRRRERSSGSSTSWFRRLQVYWVSRSRLTTVASSFHSAPLHHHRQDPADPGDRYLCRSISLLARHHRPNDPCHFVCQGNCREFDRLASDNAPQPTLSEVLLTPRPAYRRHRADD